jgi:polyhydroxybutyrate depolymerase
MMLRASAIVTEETCMRGEARKHPRVHNRLSTRRERRTLRGSRLAAMVRILSAARLVPVLVMGALIVGCFTWPGEVRAAAGHTAKTLTVDGRERLYVVHLPPGYDRGRPHPLVLMLHGMGGTATNTIRETGWSAKADREGFIVVYPEATRPDPAKPARLRDNAPAWNDGSGRFHAGRQKIDDVGFIRALLERLRADYAVDGRRVYVTGFSNGASMAFRIGAALADRVAAIAPNAGACWSATVRPVRGLAVCYLTGLDDPLNPIGGGRPRFAIGGGDRDGPAKPPVGSLIAKWLEALACAPAPVSDETRGGVRTRRYGPGRDGAEVVVITVEGLGHVWAGGVNAVPEFLVGKATDKLNATDAIWEFFRRHALPEKGRGP